jgi:hypothetical protein
VSARACEGVRDVHAASRPCALLPPCMRRKHVAYSPAADGVQTCRGRRWGPGPGLLARALHASTFATCTHAHAHTHTHAHTYTHTRTTHTHTHTHAQTRASGLHKILIDRDEQGAIAYVKGIIRDLLMNKVDMSLLVVTKVCGGAPGCKGRG